MASKKKHNNRHTGQVKFKKGTIQEVLDENGGKVTGKKTGPEGVITSIKSLLLVNVDTQQPTGECYFYYNGRWYRIC